MPRTLTDADVKQAMKQIALVNGLELTDERLERDLATYKAYLAAADRIRKFDVPLEAEPAPLFIPKPDRRS